MEIPGEGFLEIASVILIYLGFALIFYAGMVAGGRTILSEVRGEADRGYHAIRTSFTHRMVLGLDFLIGADIIATILVPTLEEIVLLASIVGVRSVMAYSLTKEAIDLDGTPAPGP